jgi:small subunit ribosomal protein S21
LQEVVRKDNESFENLFRRFNRRVQQSGKLSQVRKRQFFEKPISKNRRRVEAIRKNQIRQLRKSSLR